MVGVCRFSHVFFWGREESIGDVFVRSGYNVELYRSFIDICWVWPLPSNCDHQDDITFCPGLIWGEDPPRFHDSYHIL